MQRNTAPFNFKGIEWRYRTLTNTATLRKTSPIPRIKVKVSGQSPPPPPPLPWAKEDIAAGVIIVSCVSIWACLVYMADELEATKTEKATKRLESFQKHWVLSVHNVAEGRWYTLLTSSFVHFNDITLLVNMLGVWYLGRPIVRSWGVPNFATLYVGSGLVDSVTQFLVWKNSSPSNHSYLTCGASNGVLRLLAAFAYSIPTSRVLSLIPIKAGQASVTIIVINLINLGLDLVPSMGSAGSLGSMAFGALYTIVAVRKGRGISWKRK